MDARQTAVPKGRRENSPTFQRWVPDGPITASPEGRAEIPHTKMITIRGIDASATLANDPTLPNQLFQDLRAAAPKSNAKAAEALRQIVFIESRHGAGIDLSTEGVVVSCAP